MVVVGWILLGFGLVRFSVALFNMASRPYLPHRRDKCPRKNVSVLVPARNEEANIEILLNNFASWRDRVHELIIYDDMSSDGTYALVHRYSLGDTKVKVIRGRGLPEGWLGKNHACHRLATLAKGDIFLFIDADVTMNGSTVNRAVSYMAEHGLELLSIFPRQVMDNTGSRLTVPLMNWILLTLLPLPAVRLSGRPSLAAANGQFMMFTRDRYLELRPHRRWRMSAVEDIAIIKYYKREGSKVATLLGRDDVDCRMYGNLKEAVDGFSKNVFEFFGGSALLCSLFVMVTTAAPFWMFIFNGTAAGLYYIAIIIAIRAFVSVASRQNLFLNVLYIVPQQIMLWAITLTAIVNSKKKKLTWKGRNIS